MLCCQIINSIIVCQAKIISEHKKIIGGMNLQGSLRILLQRNELYGSRMNFMALSWIPLSHLF